MRRIFRTVRFKRAYRQYTRRNHALQVQLDRIIEEIARDPFAPKLNTHKLGGELAGLWSSSCGYDCRIIFLIERDELNREERLVFIDIGSHDEVY